MLELTAQNEDLARLADNVSRWVTRLKTRRGIVGYVTQFIPLEMLPKPPRDCRDPDHYIRARLADANWLRRRFRQYRDRGLENLARSVGVVSRHDEIYCSDDCLAERQRAAKASAEWLEATIIENENGDEVDLLTCAQSSIANPENRAHEMATRLRGTSEYYRALGGYVAMWVTWTTPGYMHPYSAGRLNPSYDGTTARAAGRHLVKMGSQARAALARLAAPVRLAGCRVVEAHHDGTPHWHCLYFVRRTDAPVVRKILRHYALKVAPNEPGARLHRCKIETKSISDGVGYLMKYIDKNLLGKHIGIDLENDAPAHESAARIDAWRSVHGVRQFQFLGGPSVTIWRELRRLRKDPGGAISQHWHAADAGDWCAYIKATESGPEITRVYDEELSVGKYGDLVARAVGLAAAGLTTITRFYKWVLQASRSVAPWSRGNNCTLKTPDLGSKARERDAARGELPRLYPVDTEKINRWREYASQVRALSQLSRPEYPGH